MNLLLTITDSSNFFCKYYWFFDCIADLSDTIDYIADLAYSIDFIADFADSTDFSADLAETTDFIADSSWYPWLECWPGCSGWRWNVPIMSP